MKFTVVFLSLLLMFSSLYNISGEIPKSKENGDEQSLTVSPNPANNHLEVKINQGLTNHKDTSKQMMSIHVQIFNNKGIMVFSSTKNVNQFSVFTGGLPEGEYNISCQIDTLVLKRSFGVKH